ncbi:MAG: LLM class F420-dependent oxidoreductase [Deltaproteobacteria bacterium]|nr:MAG: LLM class F420-dependent oxidoreductase [Deltaproteobacteria bacterium]
MARHPIRFGIQTGQQGVEWSQMLDLWRKADAWGYDSLWNFDHFYAIFMPPESPCLEGWTTLAALAQATSRARVGTLVSGNTYRHPCVTAKMAATLDHVSGGRFNLGIGAGWFELEHRAFGIDFKTVGARLAALDEACRIIKSMLTEERTTFHGVHYTVTDALGFPKPVQRPRPPIMIGGRGERVLLRIVAEHADMWNSYGHAEQMRQLIDVIRRHGDAVGRDPDQIEKTVVMPLCYRASKEREQFVCAVAAAMDQSSPDEVRGRIMIGDAQECLDTIERYSRVGVTHFLFMTFAPYVEEEMQRFAEEIIPQVRPQVRGR